MKLLTGLSTLALCAGFSLAQDNYNQWSAKKTITLNTQSSGANVSGTVTRFPTLVRLTSANSDIFAGASKTGSDIRFAKVDGVTHLKYQIERWDSAARAAEVWVLLDTVYGNSSTSFNMYWGKPGASDSSSNAVFDTANGYVGVWHFGNAPKNYPRPASVTGAPPATLRNYDSTTYVPVPGIIGKADTLAGGGGDPTGLLYNYVDFGRGNYPGFSDFSTGFAFSVWMFDTGPVAYERLLEMLDDTTTSGSSDTRIILLGNHASSPFGWSVRWGNQTAFNGASNTYVASKWQHIFFSKPSGSSPMTIYVNGVQTDVTGNYSDLAVGVRNYCYMGRSSVTASDPYYQGKLDEAVISKKARSADWVKLSYQTQRNDSSFVVFSSTAVPAPASVNYSPNPAVYTVGYAIPATAPTVTGGAATKFLAPSLPAGLSIDTITGVISGTPTSASAAANYTVTASNGSGSAPVNLNITVNTVLAAPSALRYTKPVIYAVNSAITPNTPVVTGTVTNFVVNPGLPAGLSLNATTGAISGTPTSTGAAQVILTGSNSAGSVNDTVSITVVAAPSGFSYPNANAKYPVNIAIAANTPVITGSALSYSVVPTLPPGLSLNTSSGFITGTPTTLQSPAVYIITAANVAGSITTAINITVYGAPTAVTYQTSTLTLTTGQAITPDSAIVTGVATRFSIAPALPAGLKLDTNTGVISGTPTAVSASTSYTVTASNPVGSTTTAVVISAAVSIAGGLSNSPFIHFNGSTGFSFRIPTDVVLARLSIIDMWGRQIWSDKAEPGKSGSREISWNGAANNGRHAATGSYVLKAEMTYSSGAVKTLQEKFNYKK